LDHESTGEPPRLPAETALLHETSFEPPQSNDPSELGEGDSNEQQTTSDPPRALPLGGRIAARGCSRSPCWPNGARP
jgi:hypothetical protein